MGLALKTPVSISVNVTTASTLILVANADREYALIINDSDTAIYVMFGGAAVVNTGVRLNANGGSYEMSKALGNLNQFAVYGIHGGNGNKVCCGIECS